MRRNRAAAVLALTLAAGTAAVAFAQPERVTGADRRLQAQVERIMRLDKDGNGTVSRDEMPARLAARMFDDADANGDGELSREEVEAHLGGREVGGDEDGGAEGGDEGGASGHGGGSSHEVFEGAMKAAMNANRVLSRSSFSADTRDSDLDAVQSLQEAMVMGKGVASGERMAPQAQEKYGDDVEAYQRDIRQAFVDMLRATLDLEAAILAGDSDAAREAYNAIRASQKASHDAFQED